MEKFCKTRTISERITSKTGLRYTLVAYFRKMRANTRALPSTTLEKPIRPPALLSMVSFVQIIDNNSFIYEICVPACRTVPEEKENFVSRHLTRPSGLMSASSTPRSTPRSTPIRSISPMPLSYRRTGIELNMTKANHKCSAPKFYAVPHNRLVEEGETVQFQCAIAGHPMPWSTWDHDGLIVTQTSRITIKERDDVRILEIEQVTSEDAGLYRITLENDYGRIEATARLDILTNRRGTGRTGIRTSASPARSITSSRRIMGNSTRIGGRLALAANFRGTSVPARKFYHNGEEVHESDRMHIVNDGDRSSLFIESVCAEDMGVYTCVAENEFSIAGSSTLVSFDEPNDERSPEVVRHLEGNTRCQEGLLVDLMCAVRCSKPFEMSWFKDGNPIYDSDEFRFAECYVFFM